MASRMASMVQAVQPQGPYHLIGPCTGGILAYAIARQLLSIDEEVTFVGLIDSVLEEPGNYNLVHQLRRDMKEQQLVPEEVGIELTSHPETEAELDRLIQETQRLEAQGRSFLGGGQVTKQQFLYARAIANYEPAALPAVIHQFNAMEKTKASETAPESDTLGWERVMPESSIRTTFTPGNHNSMLVEPENIVQLGSHISRELAGLPAACSRSK